MRFDVVEVDRRGADGVPGVPGDLQDHDRDQEPDDRIGDVRAKPDHDCAADDGRIRRKSVTGVSVSEGKTRATGTTRPTRARERKSRRSAWRALTVSASWRARR